MDFLSEPVADPDLPASHLPFSPAWRVGDLLLVSGQASVDRSGAIVEDGFEGQMRRSLENLGAILEGAGSSLAHVVQTRNYLRRDDDLDAFNAIYRETFRAPFPARTTLTGCPGAPLLYAIDFMAVVPHRG